MGPQPPKSQGDPENPNFETHPCLSCHGSSQRVPEYTSSLYLTTFSHPSRPFYSTAGILDPSFTPILHVTPFGLGLARLSSRVVGWVETGQAASGFGRRGGDCASLNITNLWQKFMPGSEPPKEPRPQETDVPRRPETGGVGRGMAWHEPRNGTEPMSGRRGGPFQREMLTPY